MISSSSFSYPSSSVISPSNIRFSNITENSRHSSNVVFTPPAEVLALVFFAKVAGTSQTCCLGARKLCETWSEFSVLISSGGRFPQNKTQSDQEKVDTVMEASPTPPILTLTSPDGLDIPLLTIPVQKNVSNQKETTSHREKRAHNVLCHTEMTSPWLHMQWKVKGVKPQNAWACTSTKQETYENARGYKWKWKRGRNNHYSQLG